MNYIILNAYSRKVRNMTVDELKSVATEALYHLSMIADSNISLSVPKVEGTSEVKIAEHEAAAFMSKHRI